MRTLIYMACVCGTIFVAGPETAHASTLASTAAALNDGNGPSLGVWQGSQSYSGSLAFHTLNAVVEFAVFAPGNFQTFLTTENNINFVDPAPSEYIYAYQIVEVVAGTTAVERFTVASDSDEVLGISGVTFIPYTTDYGTYPLQPIRDPSFTEGGPGESGTSSAWFADPGYAPGEYSGILFYSSPHGPEMGSSSLLAGIAGQDIPDSMPNPVPEPSALILCLAAGLSLMMRRRLQSI